MLRPYNKFILIFAFIEQHTTLLRKYSVLVGARLNDLRKKEGMTLN